MMHLFKLPKLRVYYSVEWKTALKKNIKQGLSYVLYYLYSKESDLFSRTSLIMVFKKHRINYPVKNTGRVVV